MKAIHNVFHVSLLEPARCRSGETILHQEPVEVDGENKWEIQKVLDSKVAYKTRYYLV